VFEVFFTLANAPGGNTCFVATRPHEGFRLQRLKDKLGGRCLASSEVEFFRMPAQVLGEEGRGTAVMIEQIVWTRLDALIGGAGMMRRVLAEALWHCRHRHSFGSPLIEKRAMLNVLADLALESEAAMAAAMRIASAFDAGEDPRARAFRRFALSPLKYWVAKRGAGFAAEALECTGGNGYIETMQSPMAQFYRDIQINTVWEGSGNVVALDILRAAAKDPDGVAAFVSECDQATGADPRLDAHLGDLRRRIAELKTDRDPEWSVRRLAEDMAVGLQASLLVRTAPNEVASAFCASRLGDSGRAYGTLPAGIDAEAILERALGL
jgi:putative acyl-CoA dehydrogenase